jgi:hypothetical protein
MKERAREWIYIFRVRIREISENIYTEIHRKRDIKTMLLTQLKSEQSDSEWMKAYDDDDEVKIN